MPYQLYNSVLRMGLPPCIPNVHARFAEDDGDKKDGSFSVEQLVVYAMADIQAASSLLPVAVRERILELLGEYN